MSVSVDGTTYRIDDLDDVDPWNPLWIATTIRVTAGGGDRHVHTTARIDGRVDDVPWTATIQSGHVKTGPRRFEWGWATVIGLLIGDVHTDLFDSPHERPDVRSITARVHRAVDNAVADLEQARRYAVAVLTDTAVTPDTRDQPIDVQVANVARLYNHAVALGVSDPRARVIAATGLPERTVTRRITTARELGKIKKGTR